MIHYEIKGQPTPPRQAYYFIQQFSTYLGAIWLLKVPENFKSSQVKTCKHTPKGPQKNKVYYTANIVFIINKSIYYIYNL